MTEVRVNVSHCADSELAKILKCDTELQHPLMQNGVARLPYRLTRPNAKPPTYATDGSSGMDGYVAAMRDPDWPKDCPSDDTSEPWQLDPGERVLCHLGVAFEIPPGLELQVRPRSGLALRDGVVAILGTVDSDYRGEVGATLVNLGDKPVTLAIGDRVCQLVLAPVVRAELVEVDTLTETVRGEGGFGHSGR